MKEKEILAGAAKVITRSPFALVVAIAAAVLVAELQIMFMLPFFISADSPYNEIADGFLLIVLLIPVLHFFIYRPFAGQIRNFRESEQKFRAVAQTAVDAIISINAAGEIIYWNKAAERIFGHAENEALGKPVGLVIPKRYDEAHRRGLARVRAGGPYRLVGKTVAIEGVRKDGAEFPLELSLSAWEAGGKTYFTGIIRDITDRKRQEDELNKSNESLKQTLKRLQSAQALIVRTKKLASIGILSAGVAHEILNPLNIISTTAQLQMIDDPKGATHEKMREVLDQIERAVKIVKNLGTFASKNRVEVEDVHLSTCFDQAAASMEHDLKASNIVIERPFAPDTPAIKGDANQLEQVFAILISNACDAISPRGHGTITVTARAAEHGVEFKFCDDGPGIPADILEKVFDPFFTTKDPGKGTGLGLSMAHRIIEDHGGTIWADSEAGKGVCFTIFLPKDGGSLAAG